MGKRASVDSRESLLTQNSNIQCSLSDITGSAICFRRYSFSPVQLLDNTSPNFIPDSSSWMFRLSFEVSFVTEFYLEDCQNSQKVKVVPRLFAYKQIFNAVQVLLSQIRLKIWIFHSFLLAAAIKQISSKNSVVKVTLKLWFCSLKSKKV